MTEKKEKQVNGLRTAVRYGQLTKEQALAEYNKRVAETGVRSEEFESWLSRR